MKKQILILMAFVLALVAGIQNAHAQDLTTAPLGCPTAIPIGCLTTSSPLNPLPGTPYDYEVNVTVPSGTPTFTYDWFVTTDKNFITATALTGTFDAIPSTHIAAIGTGAGLSTYHGAAGNTNKINITWQSFVPDAANPVFLVIYVKNTATCTNDNIQVFEIKPQPAFTLDLANITAAGVGAADAYATCVAPVVGAFYDDITKKVIMDYGENYVYFSVTAANFNHSWKPSFQASTSILLGTSTMDVAWAYKAESYTGATSIVWHTTTLNAGTYESTDVVNAPSNGAVGSSGECIIVRVHIDHNNEPTLLDNTITFAVDGVMKDPAATVAANYYTNTAFGDLHSNSADAADCGKTDGFKYDKTTQIISARPTIIEVTPASPAFIPKTN